jgi:hypothetical protein
MFFPHFNYISNNQFIIRKLIEMDHVKPSLVHDFFYIQSIGMIPFTVQGGYSWRVV